MELFLVLVACTFVPFAVGVMMPGVVTLAAYFVFCVVVGLVAWQFDYSHLGWGAFLLFALFAAAAIGAATGIVAKAVSLFMLDHGFESRPARIPIIMGGVGLVAAIAWIVLTA